MALDRYRSSNVRTLMHRKGAEGIGGGFSAGQRQWLGFNRRPKQRRKAVPKLTKDEMRAVAAQAFEDWRRGQ